MKKLNYAKLFRLFIVLSLLIATTFTNFVEAAPPELLRCYKSWHDSVYRHIIEKEKYSVQEMQTVENFLKASVDKCDFSMNVPIRVVEKIISEDKIKSRVELEWSHFENAEFDEKNVCRRWTTPEFFNVNGRLLLGKDYEKYGYLSCKDKNSDNFMREAMYISQFYGNVVFNLKKDRLIDRTTLTIGDSLDNRCQLGKNSITPTMANDPKIVCVPGYSKNLVSLLANSVNENKLLPQYPNLIRKIKYPNLDLDYFELQFHGELSFKNDVESVDIIRTSTQSKEEKEAQEQVAKKIKNLGIKTNIVDCSVSNNKV